MSPAALSESCALCGSAALADELAEAAWIAPEIEERLAVLKRGWQRTAGACPACVQHALLETLLEKGEAAFHESVQRVWPLDAEAAFGALPTPLRLHADPRFTGRGVTIALVDAAFHPHPDFVLPRNRIRAWVDATRAPVEVRRFGPEESPRWPGWDAGSASQWHGLMTTAVAAGSGTLSHGLYRGLAPDAELVLLHVHGDGGHIGNGSIARALEWLAIYGPELGVRVVNLSLGGDPVTPLAGNPIDEAVAALAQRGIVVIAAAGNDGARRLVPPGTAPAALTIGGLDDRNTLDPSDDALWHSNYGETHDGRSKPELVAPSLWVVAPILPATEVAREGARLFAGRARSDAAAEARLKELKLVTPHYQHVDGTSFAAPVVAGVVAAMLEANPTLRPLLVRELLLESASPVPGAPPERQGAGALDAGRAVALALAEQHSRRADFRQLPRVDDEGIRFLLHQHGAGEASLVGRWDGWGRPGLALQELEDGVWEARLKWLRPGEYRYKFVIDGEWLTDPANPRRAHDGYGNWNSVFVV